VPVTVMDAWRNIYLMNAISAIDAFVSRRLIAFVASTALSPQYQTLRTETGAKRGQKPVSAGLES